MEIATQSARSPVPPVRARPGRIGAIAYAAMASGLIFYVVTLWIQVFIDTRRARSVSVDALSEAHRHWRLRSSLLFLIWSIFGILTFPLGVGWLILIPAWLWYAYRIGRGALCYRLGVPPSGEAT